MKRLHVSIALAAIQLLFMCMPASAKVYMTTLPGGSVQIHWTPDTNVRRIYSIYRMTMAESVYPTMPLARVSTPSCATIETILRKDPAFANFLHEVAPPDAGAMNIPRLAMHICGIVNGDVTSTRYRLFARLATGHWRMAQIMGTYYEDTTSRTGITYTYDVRYPASVGQEVSITSNSSVVVVAGRQAQIATPTNVAAYAGDARIQLVWTQPVGGSPYVVVIERATSANAWSNAVTLQTLGAQVDTSITGARLGPMTASYIDNGGRDGLINGRDYVYRVRFIAAGGAASSYSQIVTARPIDRTPPAPPQQITVQDQPTSRTVLVQWNPTHYDVRQRTEVMGSYLIYRVLQDADQIEDETMIGEVVATQQGRSNTKEQFIDRQAPHDPCRSTTVGYRIVAKDAAGNVGLRSAVATGVLIDFVPPERVKELRTASTTSTITLNWPANTDCGVMRYNVYRALCDYGQWTPCPSPEDTDETTRYIEDIKKRRQATARNRSRQGADSGSCGGPFLLIGSVGHRDGVPSFSFVDETVPVESPLCYAYIVSAQDSAGNQSVSMPLPHPQLDRVVCANLIDVVSPSPGFITNLVPKDNQIIVQVMSPPAQDLAGFYLYRRSDSSSPFTFVEALMYSSSAGSFVATTQKLPVQHETPISCDLIPLGAMVEGAFTEFTQDSILDRRTQWYKVTVVDRNGNESSVDSTTDVGTFTYGRTIQPDLFIRDIQVSADGGHLLIYPAHTHTPKVIKNYALYRSDSENGLYQQIGATVMTNVPSDRSARRGRRYWYKFMVTFEDGTYSNLSPAKEGMLP